MPPNEGADYAFVPLGEQLARLSPSPSECCVFRVHNKLRSVNEKAYEPVIIAIGPYHDRSKDSLKMMEEYKLHYLRFLLVRQNDSNCQRYLDAITPLEEEARKFYAETIKLNKRELIEMMILDGCFIIELFRKFDTIERREQNDPIFKVDWIVTSLQRDLLLFENQLPFRILLKLFNMTKHSGENKSLIDLALRVFSDLVPGPGYTQDLIRNRNYQNKHLLGLIHNNWLPSFARMEPNGDVSDTNKKTWQFIPCATNLREAGIKFKTVEEGNIKFKTIEEGKVKEDSLFDIKFKNGVMQIPRLTIENRTDSFLRNLIAYEQYGPSNNLNYITDYVKFMDCLICSPKDVEILRHYGITDNWIGDDEKVSAIFNKICDSVTGPGNHFHYAGIFNEVNIHYNKRVKRWMAKLLRNYCNSPWAFISVMAAAVLLLLTLTQTVFTVFPRK